MNKMQEDVNILEKYLQHKKLIMYTEKHQIHAIFQIPNTPNN